MTRELGRWSLDNEKRKRSFSPDKRWRACSEWRLFAIHSKTEATRGAGRWSLDNEKRRQPSRFDG